mmetsp:Transcript_7868/g.15799  ORF Transcript_7868/g.15799 Transcript_7868/m.15799 type:complete len:280 (-) Transcript_7868:53-892(-)|eukprot:CAMPEP_0196723132 /NCGR_PEP_ID=MMETSP1091-20130531/5294_1 /TAXON_ID=302021 /ORGANISM="Rhodomonas sp., Strain CCMP768" /LENGTH=279 /DNA_ID=CAMNT_0042064963 /DNA_START=12 /DNA_END=851 /DNA_ORIENTATION=+
MLRTISPVVLAMAVLPVVRGGGSGKLAFVPGIGGAMSLIAPVRRVAASAPLMQLTSAGSEPSGNNVLYAKAGPGGVLGDCPFTHKANFALRAKGLDYPTTLIDFDAKPAWFLESINPKGSVPVFVTEDGKCITESDDIVAWADAQSPSPQLLGRANSDKALEVVGKVFPAAAGLIKNQDASLEDEKRGALKAALAALNEFLASNPGPLLLGEDISSEDCRLVGPLYHASVAIPHYKKYDPLAEFPAVQAYLAALKSTNAWKATEYTPDVVQWGWSKFYK